MNRTTVDTNARNVIDSAPPSALGASAAARPIWRIGNEGGGSTQFGGEWTIDERQAQLEYVVGSSDVAAWPALHPGPLNAAADIDYTARVRFARPSVAGPYEVRLAVAATGRRR